MNAKTTARLAAAVLGASVLTGAAALPAAAATWTPEHGVPSGGFFADWAGESVLEFTLYDNFDREDMSVVAVGADGTEVDVEFDFATEMDMGAVFLDDAVAKLGEQASQGFEVYVYGAGQRAFGAAIHADGTLDQIEADELIPFDDWAEHSTWYVVTDQNSTVVESLVADDGGVPSPIDAELTVAPEHGDVVIGSSSFGYTPDTDFIGRDRYEVVMVQNGVTRTVEFIVDVQDLPGDSTPVVIEPETPAEPTEPAEPTTPAEPTEPAEPTTPAEPTEPTEPAEETGEHTVPETVETGSGAAWGLAGVAAVAGGALVRFRRAFGLA